MSTADPVSDSARTATTPTVEVLVEDLLGLERYLRSAPQQHGIAEAEHLNRLMRAIPIEAFRASRNGRSGPGETP